MKHNKYILQSLVSLQKKAVKHEGITNYNIYLHHSMIDPLEFAEFDEYAEDASSAVSNEEDIEHPFEFVEASPMDDDLSES